MRKTPDPISKERQGIRSEIDRWEAGIAAARANPQAETISQVAFGTSRLIECRKRLAILRRKGKRSFWKS